MTTPTQGEHAQPEALRTIAEWPITDPSNMDAVNMAAVARAALTAAPQGGAYVENPAEIEHVAGDVSKNRAESNMTGGAVPAHHTDNAPLGYTSHEKSAWSFGYEEGYLASHGQAPADPDGEAFRTAAHLGLTLRFYGGCAQSSMPGTPSAYVVVTCRDRAAGMREAVQRAATVIENGGESQRLDATTAQPAPAGAPQADSQPAPIDMVLHCPACGMQHIDAPDQCLHSLVLPEAQDWNNPPHRSHLCHGCGHIWRPADVPTNGVKSVKTAGKADSPIATRAPAASVAAPAAGAVTGWQMVPVSPTQDMLHAGWHHGSEAGGIQDLDLAYCAMLAAAPTPAAQGEDAALLDWLRDNTCDLRCISVPTGADDADVDWVVIEHYEAKPQEREIARGYSDDPRAAIRAAALAQKEGTHGN